jgi:pimeloyl-ACP methyl ester carboxylesterase
MRQSLMAYQGKTRDELMAAQHAAQPAWSQGELGPWADSKLRVSLNVLNRLGAPPVEWDPILKAIRCPALLITADPERGAMVTAEAARALQELVPQLRIQHIAGAGHNVRREQFGSYIATVRAFLAGWRTVASA